MTCLMDRSLSGALIKLHTSMLGTFFYTPWHKVCQFSRKNLRRYFWEKVANFVYYIKNHFYVIHKVWNFFPEISAKIFSWKSAYLVPRCIQKTSPTYKYETSSLLRSEQCFSSKSLKYFINRVCNILSPCVYIGNVYSPCLAENLGSKTHFPILPMDIWYLVGTTSTKKSIHKKIPLRAHRPPAARKNAFSHYISISLYKHWTYTRGQKSTHPISKVLQWLPW